MSKQDDLLFQLQDELRLRLTSNPELKAIFRKIQSGTATLDDTFRYSQISSELLGNFLSEKVSELSPSDREYVCCELLKSRHFDINQRVAEVQRLTDKKNRLNLNPQKATFPTERVQQIAHSLADPTVPIETIQRRADSSVANVGLSFHDDCIQENAKFRSNAGLKCRIVRTTDGKCCKWCTSMAGRWVYGEEPPDVYRRHDNCTCSVTFENDRERQNVRNKKMREVKEDFQPIVLSREQAVHLQNQNLQYRGLTNTHLNDTIKDKETDIMLNTRLFHGKIVFSAITDERINRISDIQTSILSKENNNKLTQSCKELLKFMKDDELGKEGVFIFNMQMGELDKYKADNTNSQIKFRPQKENCIVIHNHPSSTVLSDTDLFKFYSDDKIKIMGAVGHNGSTFFVEKTEDYDFLGFSDYLQECRLDFPIVMSNINRLEYVEKIMEGAEEYGVKFYTKIYN